MNRKLLPAIPFSIVSIAGSYGTAYLASINHWAMTPMFIQTVVAGACVFLITVAALGL